MVIHNTSMCVYWEGPLMVDADGSPNAYGPPSNPGLDYLANAGHDGDWYGLVVGPNGKPLPQGPGDPSPGRFISTTALQDRSKRTSDPARYVDSEQVCYMSIPGDAPARYGLHPGDVGFLYSHVTGQACAAVVADVGPKGKWGEASIASAAALGLPVSPKHGGAGGGVVYIIFKGSRKGWPRTNEAVAQQVQDLIDSVGGFERFVAAAPGPVLRA